jgi:hypothetical protein
MEVFWVVLAWLHGWFYWQDPLVGALMDEFKSEICVCTISQSSQDCWWYVSGISMTYCGC